MKNSEKSLDLLLHAAGRSRVLAVDGAANDAAPYGFATRVVAGWRAATGEGRGLEAKLQTIWFGRALVCALAVMAVSVGWSFKMDTAAPNDEMALASYDASADLP